MQAVWKALALSAPLLMRKGRETKKEKKGKGKNQAELVGGLEGKVELDDKRVVDHLGFVLFCFVLFCYGALITGLV